MKELNVNENLHLFKEYDFTPNEHGYIGYTFHNAKRWASAVVKKDEKGTYFTRKNVKYYIESLEVKQEEIEVGKTVKTSLEGLEDKKFKVVSYSNKFKWFYCECLESRIKYTLTADFLELV